MSRHEALSDLRESDSKSKRRLSSMCEAAQATARAAGASSTPAGRARVAPDVCLTGRGAAPRHADHRAARALPVLWGELEGTRAVLLAVQVSHRTIACWRGRRVARRPARAGRTRARSSHGARVSRAGPAHRRLRRHIRPRVRHHRVPRRVGRMRSRPAGLHTNAVAWRLRSERGAAPAKCGRRHRRDGVHAQRAARRSQCGRALSRDHDRILAVCRG